MKILFLGMNSTFSAGVLAGLVEGGYVPEALAVPHPQGRAGLPRLVRLPEGLYAAAGGARGTFQIAAAHQVPVIEIGSPKQAAALGLAAGFAPDLVVTACFPYRLPAAWLGLPRLGCLNLHPALLPAYRGPDPLFWQFRQGEAQTGVTLHFMDAALDTGDIAGQRLVVLPDGAATREAEEILAAAGAALLCEALEQPQAIPRRRQPLEGASYFPAPRAADRVIPLAWEARRAFNFMRGAQDWGPFVIRGAGFEVGAARAVGVALSGADEHHFSGDGIVGVQFADGVVWVESAALRG